jgi:hypothetical protein
VKLEYPWAGEGDPLGQRLWLESGTRVKFMEFQVRNIRDLGLPEDEILEQFGAYLNLHGGRCKKPKNVPAGFYLYLKGEVMPGKKVR